ncbi:MAG: hypothetical protein RIT81_18755 [Deltaproteobacteria bacterium]
MRSWWFAAAALILGCGARQRDVTLEGLDAPVAFAVVVEGATPREIVGPFAIVGGRTEPRTRLSVDLDRAQLILLRAPFGDDASLTSMEPPDSPRFDGAGRIEGAVPADVEFFVLEDDRFVAADREVAEALTWSAPAPPQCDAERLVSFATAAALLPSAPAYAGDLTRVRRLDDERVVAMSRGNVYLFTRDDVPDAPTHDELLPLDGATNVEALDLDVIRTEAGFSGVVAATARGCDQDPACVEGRLYTFSIVGRTLRWAGTATVVADRGLRAVAFDAAGDALAAGEAGVRLVLRSDGQAERLADLPVEPGRRVERVMRTATRDVVAATDVVFEGDLTTDTFTTRRLEAAETVDPTGLAVSIDDETWMTTLPAGVLRAEGEGFVEHSPTLPPSITPCLDAAGGLSAAHDVARFGPRMAVTFECSGVLLFATQLDCVNVAFGDEGASPSDAYFALDGGEDLVVAGARGTLVVVEQ